MRHALLIRSIANNLSGCVGDLLISIGCTFVAIPRSLSRYSRMLISWPFSTGSHGWKDTTTLERVYQQPDPEIVEAVVLGARELTIRTTGERIERQERAREFF